MLGEAQRHITHRARAPPPDDLLATLIFRVSESDEENDFLVSLAAVIDHLESLPMVPFPASRHDGLLLDVLQANVLSCPAAVLPALRILSTNEGFRGSIEACPGLLNSLVELAGDPAFTGDLELIRLFACLAEDKASNCHDRPAILEFAVHSVDAVCGPSLLLIRHLTRYPVTNPTPLVDALRRVVAAIGGADGGHPSSDELVLTEVVGQILMNIAWTNSVGLTIFDDPEFYGFIIA